MNNYKLVELGEVCSFENGDRGKNYPSKEDFVKEGIPFINGGMIDGNYINEKELKYITFEKFKSLRAGKAKKGDILLSLRGTLGKCVICPYDNAAIASALVIIRPQKDLDNDYLFYMLNSEYLLKQEENYDNGSVQANLSVNVFKSFTIPFMEITKQKKFVKVLNDLNTRINNNNKIITNIEELLKTIYQRWFIEFEFPDSYKYPYKSNNGKMIYNKKLKKEIPEGWDYLEIGEIESNIVTGKTPSTKDKNNFGGDIPFITIDDIRKGLYINNTARSLSKRGADSQKNKYIPQNTICVSCIATVGLIGITTRESQTNQQINSIVCKEKDNLFYLVNALRDYFKYSNGAKTGNIFDNMNKDDFSSIEIVYPSKSVLSNYTKIVEPLYNKIKECIVETDKLFELRDFLLPMLMNGQIQFKDI